MNTHSAENSKPENPKVLPLLLMLFGFRAPSSLAVPLSSHHSQRWLCVCVYTASHMQFINCLDAGECGMIVGPRSTKLPQSWDTGSDQPSVPASFDVFLFHSIWQGATEQGLDTVMQAHIHKLERYLRVFQGRWRDKSKQYFSVTLRHIPAIVQYLLDNSYFTVGSQGFRQCRGASMGSQFAPVLCSAVALQREWNYHLSFSPFTWDRSLHHRYVDNRILLTSQHSQCQTHVRIFWNLQFYSSPILLEVVSMWMLVNNVLLYFCPGWNHYVRCGVPAHLELLWVVYLLHCDLFVVAYSREKYRFPKPKIC